MSLLRVELVLATIGRTVELQRFLDSLGEQDFSSFRLIVVDQNEDDRVQRLLDGLGSSVDMLRLRSAPGLSRARNVALPHLEGDLVAFPDDDCRYPRDLLRSVVEVINERDTYDGVSVRSVDATGRPSNMLWDKHAGAIDRRNVWRRAISYTLFLRRAAVDEIGAFDERLGAGSGTVWEAGEESEYLLRGLARGLSFWYEPSLAVVHESPRPLPGRQSRVKGFRSGAGHGEVLRRYGYPWWFAAWRTGQLLAGAGAFLVRGRASEASFYAAMAAGRAVGWLRPKIR